MIRKLITGIALVAIVSFTANAFGGTSAADAVTAATQANKTSEVNPDKVLDQLESVVKDLEKLAADQAAGVKPDTKLAESVNERLLSLNDNLNAIANTQLTETQEARANALLERLYAIIGSN